MKKKYAIVTVSDQRNLAMLKRIVGQDTADWTVLASGGTGKKLTDLGVLWTPVSEYTQTPELFRGLVKTIHPKIAGGILYDRDNAEHVAEAEQFGIADIRLVLVNFYDFDSDKQVSKIDIGGPTLARAGVKGAKHVTVVINPDDYETVFDEIVANGDTTPETRLNLASKVMRVTGENDRSVATWLARHHVAKTNPFLMASTIH